MCNEREIFIAGGFQFFKLYDRFNMAMGLWTFCWVFFSMWDIWMLNGQIIFREPNAENQERENWGNAGKESFLGAAAFMNEAANRVKEGGSVKNKMKNRGAQHYIRQHPE